LGLCPAFHGRDRAGSLEQDALPTGIRPQAPRSIEQKLYRWKTPASQVTGLAMRKSSTP
jgi:hypothetical protein